MHATRRPTLLSASSRFATYVLLGDLAVYSDSALSEFKSDVQQISSGIEALRRGAIPQLLARSWRKLPRPVDR